MSDLQPHHHVLRRVFLDKHLNLADDQALVNRLIASGCVSEEFIHNNSCFSKKEQNKYFAWLKNQSYELFLNFLECLRGDEKYSKLVYTLDGALAEHVGTPECSGVNNNETTTMGHQFCHSSNFVVNKLPFTTEICTKENFLEGLAVGDEETAVFTSEGGEMYSFLHKFHVVVPPNAIPSGKQATLNVLGCCSGPFLLPSNCRSCSDFMFVRLEGIDFFQQPVLVEISHNLMISDYSERHHNVVICHCSAHKMEGCSQLVFTKIARPNVSNVDSVLSFHLQNFCGLCAAYEVDRMLPHLKPSMSENGKFKHQSIHHDFSLVRVPESKCCYPLFLDSESNSKHSIATMNSPKRKLQDDTYDYTSVVKRMCQPEYTMLCYWQLSLLPGAMSFVMFVCKNCPTSIAACKLQVKELVGTNCNPSLLLYKHFDFFFNKNRKVLAEVNYQNTAGWTVVTRTKVLEVHENEVLGDLWSWQSFDNGSVGVASFMRNKVADHQYPPRMIVDIYYHKEQAEFPMLNVTLSIDGVYGISDSNKSLCFHVHSSMFTRHSLCTSSFSNDDAQPDSVSRRKLSPDFSKYTITRRILIQVAIVLDRLEQVAYHLNIDKHQVLKLQMEHSSQSELCYQLLLHWWQQQQPTESNLEHLYMALCITGQGDCLLDVLKHDSDYNNIKTVSKQSGIDEEILKGGVGSDTNLLQEVAVELRNWCYVGRALELKESELQQIQYDYQQSIERGYQMLNKWRQKNGSAAKLSQLVIGLLIMNQFDAVDFLKCRKYYASI